MGSPDDTLTFEASEGADTLRDWARYVRQAEGAGWGQLPSIGRGYAAYGARVVVHLGRDPSGTITCGALVLCFRPLPLPLSFGICPGGPVAVGPQFGRLMTHLRSWGRARGLSHIMMSPATATVDWPEHGEQLRPGSAFAPVRYPLRSLALDVRRSDEELLASFRADTRRNVRHAVKGGHLLERVETAERAREVAAWIHQIHREQNVPVRAIAAFEELAEQLVLRAEGEVLAVLGDGAIRAAGIFPIAGNTMWYLSGARARAASTGTAAHLLQFRAMTRARDLGLHHYDFTSRSVASVFEFKRGFRPVEYETAGEYDLPIYRSLYHALRIAGPWALRHRRTIGAWITRVRKLTRGAHT